MKTCKTCLKNLPLSLFYKHRAMKDGLLNFCIDCVKIRVKKHRKQNLEKIRKYDRLRGRTAKRKLLATEVYKKTKKQCHLRSHEWRKRNPIKTRAHAKVARAIKKGLLHKGCCEVCSNKMVEAHHADYNKPLNVAWLCKKHHSEKHRKYKDATNETLLAVQSHRR